MAQILKHYSHVNELIKWSSCNFWPRLLSSRPESSPHFPVTAELHQHCPHHRAVRPEPTSSQYLHSTHEHVRPGQNRRTGQTINQWQKHDLWIYFIFSKNRHKTKYILSTFAATSALISSWVSASLFLASSVLRSQSAMNDWRCSAAWE